MKIKTEKSSLSNVWKWSLLFFAILLLFCMLKNPAKYISVSLDGISAWAFNVLPAVLPFMFFTRILSSLEETRKLSQPFSKISNFLFKTPPISLPTFFLAILSGYPVGSKLVADLYMQGKISRNDAFKMSSFCSTSGPMFIVGAVGVGMFHSAKIGHILLVSHILGAILCGVCFRLFKLKKDETLPPQNDQKTQFDLSEIVLNSTLSILMVGCIICVFFIIIEALSPVFSLLPKPLNFFLQGLVEITKGSISLSSFSNIKLATILTSFVISFGGFSTLLQSLSMLSKLKMPLSIFALQKTMHGVFSCIVTILLISFF